MKAIGTGQKKKRVLDPQASTEASDFKFEVADDFIDADEIESQYIKPPYDDYARAWARSKAGSTSDVSSLSSVDAREQPQ